jgi:hypothetical protein
MNVGIGNEAEAVSFLGIFVSNFWYSVFAVQYSLDSVDIKQDPRCTRPE